MCPCCAPPAPSGNQRPAAKPHLWHTCANRSASCRRRAAARQATVTVPMTPRAPVACCTLSPRNPTPPPPICLAGSVHPLVTWLSWLLPLDAVCCTVAPLRCKVQHRSPASRIPTVCAVVPPLLSPHRIITCPCRRLGGCAVWQSSCCGSVDCSSSLRLIPPIPSLSSVLCRCLSVITGVSAALCVSSTVSARQLTLTLLLLGP